MYGEYQQAARRDSESAEDVGDLSPATPCGSAILRTDAVPHFSASRSFSAQTVIEHKRDNDNDNDIDAEAAASDESVRSLAGSSRSAGSTDGPVEWTAASSDDHNDINDEINDFIDESAQSNDINEKTNDINVDEIEYPHNNSNLLLIDPAEHNANNGLNLSNGSRSDENVMANEFHQHNHALNNGGSGLCVIRGSSNFTNTICIQATDRDPYDDKNEMDGELAGVQLARAHWMQLHKLNLQWRVVQRMFILLLQRHPDLRPVWQFAWEVRDFGRPDWSDTLLSNRLFRGQCTSYQAAITLIMDNIDEPDALAHLLRELGAHHFYYDAIETHLDMLREAFLRALISVTQPDVLDESILDAWDEFWTMVGERMGEGIARQRAAYLAQCVTRAEMAVVRRTWERLRSHSLADVGDVVAATSAKTFCDLWRKFHASDTVEDVEAAGRASRYFGAFCASLLARYDATLAAYAPDAGFATLVERMRKDTDDGECRLGAIVALGPSLVRRAFMDGFVATLIAFCLTSNAADLPTTPRESLVHIWGKIYRVHEQAIISNEMARRHSEISSI